MKAKFMVIFAAALAVVPMASNAGMMFTLDAGDSFNGFILDGFKTNDVLTVNFIDPDKGLSTWNAWGRTTCEDPAGTTPGSGVCAGWITNLAVDFGVGSPGSSTTVYASLRYPSEALAFAAATPLVLTGYESYGFRINDSNFSDNVGGLSLDIDVAVPIPAPLGIAVNRVPWAWAVTPQESVAVHTPSVAHCGGLFID